MWHPFGLTLFPILPPRPRVVLDEAPPYAGKLSEACCHFGGASDCFPAFFYGTALHETCRREPPPTPTPRAGGGRSFAVRIPSRLGRGFRQTPPCADLPSPLPSAKVLLGSAAEQLAGEGHGNGAPHSSKLICGRSAVSAVSHRGASRQGWAKSQERWWLQPQTRSVGAGRLSPTCRPCRICRRPVEAIVGGPARQPPPAQA